MNSAIFEGTVMHQRMVPRKHRFSYGVYYLWLDLDELADLDRSITGFGVDRAALVSFHERDHGPRDGSSLRPWIDEALTRAGMRLDPTEHWPIRILTMPRVLGYQFNPISVWCCYDPGGSLRAVLYEVSNTYGEWHHYLHPVQGLSSEGTACHTFPKELFVSPFIGQDAIYAFRVRPPDDRAAVLVRETLQGEEVLRASFVGRRVPLTTSNLWREFFRYPLVTMKVIGGIHLEATRLWSKGVRFRWHRDVPLPAADLTIGSDARGTVGEVATTGESGESLTGVP